MTDRVDLYDSHYGRLEAQTYQEIRRETYQQDLGQTSWITLEECNRLLTWLNAKSRSRVLEIACGSGGVSVLMARQLGAEVVGIDINPDAIQAATQRASQERLTGQVRFQLADASSPLPFPAQSFEALFCNDSINHLPDRFAVLKDWHRLLRPAGRVLYTDPIIVTGPLSHEEIAIRSSIGFYLFIPPGENERLLHTAGFELLHAEDLTEAVAMIARRWRQARDDRRELLVKFEGEDRFEGLQRFLSVVSRLASERRLSRYAFCAEKKSS